ncbi:hypothetical protein DENSPDRAFT_237391 [Dentipellis sp. KUC8613]|nr:hypothetical protein DENSPDRAFT_237391 [Dentipellis sp. KUC8613]
MPPPSDHCDEHTTVSVPSAPRFPPQDPRQFVDPRAFSPIGHLQQMTGETGWSVQPDNYHQRPEQCTPSIAPHPPAPDPPSHPWAVRGPVRTDSLFIPHESQHLSQSAGILARSSYDPALNDFYRQIFAESEAGSPAKQEGIGSRASQDQDQECAAQIVPLVDPSLANVPSSSRQPSYPPAPALKSVSRLSSFATSQAPTTFALPANIALRASSTTSTAPWFVPSNSTGSSSTSLALHSTPQTPRTDIHNGQYHGTYTPYNYQNPVQPTGTVSQLQLSDSQQPLQSPMVNAPFGSPYAWNNSTQESAATPYTELMGGHTPRNLTANVWSGYPQQSADASSVFRHSGNSGPQRIPSTPLVAPPRGMPVQGIVPQMRQTQAPPPLGATLSSSSSGPLPQTGLHFRTSQYSQAAASIAAPFPGASQPGTLGDQALASRAPSRQIGTDTAASTLPAPPHSGKRKASASPLSEATEVKATTKYQAKRTRQGKGKVTEPSADLGDAVEDAPRLPVESPAAAQVRKVREARRARRFRDLYDEIVPELSSPRIGRNPSDDDVLRMAKDVVQKLKVDINGMKEEVSRLNETEQRTRSQLQAVTAEFGKSQQALGATRRWGEEAWRVLGITRRESESWRCEAERLKAEKDGVTVQWEAMKGELESKDAELSRRTEENQQMTVQMQQLTAQLRQCDDEKLKLEHELTSTRIELQRYRSVMTCHDDN